MVERTPTPTESETDDLFEIPQETRERTTPRSERISRWLDKSVYAPARVAIRDIRMPIGVLVVSFFIFLGTVGVRIVDKPEFSEGERYVKPFGSSFWLGTDHYGADIFGRLVHGTPNILLIALAGIIFATVVAVIIGTVAGYKGGRVDTLLMMVTDVVMTIPALPLIVVLVAIWQPQNPFAIGAVLAINNWPGLARAIRSQVLTIRSESYVEAARTMGISTPRLLTRDVIPQLMPYTLVNGANAARAVIFEAVGLYFLNVFPKTNNNNWGVMMNQAHNQGAAMSNLDHFYWLLFPMLTVVLFSFGLIMLSQGMDRVFNPRLRAKHAKTVGGEDEESGT